MNFAIGIELTTSVSQIATARIGIAMSQKIADFVKSGPENLVHIAKSYFQYIRDLLKQLSEVPVAYIM
jgi:hypothetical protein